MRGSGSEREKESRGIRVKSRLLVRLLVVLFACAGCGHSRNTILVGENFQKGQRSSKVLQYAPIAGWGRDEAAEKKLGLYAVLVPMGQSIDNAKSVITIAFQAKNANTEGLRNLTEFFKVDMMNMMQQFPDSQYVRWQPAGINPDVIPFMSIEVYGKEIDKPSPHRVVYVDSGDGFYSVTLTTEEREWLNRAEFLGFFDSLRLR